MVVCVAGDAMAAFVVSDAFIIGADVDNTLAKHTQLWGPFAFSEVSQQKRKDGIPYEL